MSRYKYKLARVPQGEGISYHLTKDNALEAKHKLERFGIYGFHIYKWYKSHKAWLTP